MKKRLLLAFWLLPYFNNGLFAQTWETETLRADIVGAWSRTADFDNDGDPDILLQAGDSIYWHENLRPGWTAHLVDPTFLQSAYGYVDVFDIDIDGDMDIIKASGEGNGFDELSWNENQSNGSEWVKHSIEITEKAVPWLQNGYGDIDSDGDIDLAICQIDFSNLASGALYWLEQTPDPAVWVKHPLKTGSHWFSSLCDMEGDGDLDILSSSPSMGVFWLENQLPSTSWLPHSVAPTFSNEFWIGTCADLDSDGDPDVVAGPSNSLGTFALFDNPGWSGTTIYQGNGFMYLGPIGDMDNDGDPDLSYGGSGNISLPLGWSENLGSGNWQTHLITPSTLLQQIPTGLADIDGDGDTDIVALTFDYNTGSGSVFWASNPMIELPNINIHSVATVRQVGGDHGYTLDGDRMSNHSRPKLLNPDNFGAGGTYQKTISITDAYGSSGSLEAITSHDDVDLFYFGIFNTLEPSYIPLTEAELDSLYAWSERGGKLIIGASAPGSPIVHVPNVLNGKWGFDVVLNFPSTTIFPTVEGAGTAIFDGPFGTIPSANQGGLAKGYFNLIPENVVILGEDADGGATLLLDCKTLDLIVADGDTYTDLGGVSAGPEVLNDNDRFWLNTIAYMDQLQGPPVIEQDGNTLSVGGYLSYQWLLDGQPIDGATDSAYMVNVSGNYSVLALMSCGCEVTSAEVAVAVSGVEDQFAEFEIVVFPNPATGWVELKLPTYWVESYQVEIFDMNGRLLLSAVLKGGAAKEIDLTGVSRGSYFLKVFNEKGVGVARVVKL